jgi:hypothetical protein
MQLFTKTRGAGNIAVQRNNEMLKTPPKVVRQARETDLRAANTEVGKHVKDSRQTSSALSFETRGHLHRLGSAEVHRLHRISDSCHARC